MVNFPPYSERILSLFYPNNFYNFFSPSMLRFSRIFLYVLRSLFLIFVLIYRSILIYFFLQVPFAYPRRTAKAFLSTNNTSCSTSPVADKSCHIFELALGKVLSFRSRII